MKNKGIKIGVVFILLFALLSVAGCQQEDVVIVGAESGQPGPTSGQLRIGFTLLVSKGASTQPSRDITINNLSLSADTSFTVTNTDTGDTTVLTGAVIDTDPTFTYVNFDEDDDILPASTRVSILIPYTLEPGNYKVTAVTGSVKYPSSSGTSVKDLSLARDGDGLNITFTIAAPELTPTPEPTATPTVEPTATPTVSNKVEFTKDGDRVNAKIILDKPVSAENIKMYVVYKENDVLKRVETVNVNDDLTAEFTISNELKNAEISVYIWNDKMNPYMDIQQITSLATKCRQLQKSHLAM